MSQTLLLENVTVAGRGSARARRGNEMFKGIVHPELKLRRLSAHPDVDRGSDDIF